MKQAHLFIFGLMVLTMLVGCGETLPVDFTASTVSNNPLKVTFKANLPTSSNEYGEMKATWDFGDGVILSDESPTHTYKEPGDYTVKLTMEASKSFVSTAEKVKVIPVAVDIQNLDFTYLPDPLSPLSITFEAQGRLDNGVLDFEWDFGFGKTARGKNIVMTFPEPRVYPVTLTVRVQDTTYTQTVKKEVDLNLAIKELDFTYNPDPYDPLNVEFIASGTPTMGEIEYSWDFGYGSVKKGKSVVHKFKNVGWFEVNLTANIIDSQVKEEVNRAINTSMSITNADFTYGSHGGNPLEIIFNGTGESPTGDIEYEWDFGGGIKLRTQDTSYPFNDYGEHVVTLKVSIPGTKIAKLVTKKITIDSPVIEGLDFTYEQSKTDRRDYYFKATAKAPYGKITYNWDFGWGQTASGKTARKKFEDFGDQLVRLNVAINDTPTESYIEKVINIPAPTIKWKPDPEDHGILKPFKYKRHPKNHTNVVFVGTSEASEGELEYEWDFSWGKKGEGENVAVDFEYYGRYPVTVTAKIKDTKVKKIDSQSIDVGVNTRATIDCYDTGGDNIDNLLYTCVPTITEGEKLVNPVYSWKFGDNASGPANVSTEMMPSHKFPVLGVYNVELTISDDKNTEDIVVSKDIVVLTIPIIDFRVRVLEQRLGDNVRLAHDLYSTWQKVNKKQVDVIVEISGSENSAVNGTHINDPRDFFVTKDENYRRPHDGSKTWNTCANFWVNITYRLKENKTIEKSTGVTAINCMWRDYLD